MFLLGFFEGVGGCGGAEIVILVCLELRRNVEVIDMAVATKDMRLQSRVLRQTRVVRKKLTAVALAGVVKKCMTEEDAGYGNLVKYLFEHPTSNGVDGMEIEKPPTSAPPPARVVTSTADMAVVNSTTGLSSVPEISAYLQLLNVALLVDLKRNEEAVEASTALVDFISGYNRRTMDDISSRAYFFYSRAYELTGNLAIIRSRLLSAYRTACLRHDHSGQAMLLNLLLRNYIHYNLYDQADKLVSMSFFPPQHTHRQKKTVPRVLLRFCRCWPSYGQIFPSFEGFVSLCLSPLLSLSRRLVQPFCLQFLVVGEPKKKRDCFPRLFLRLDYGRKSGPAQRLTFPPCVLVIFFCTFWLTLL